MYTRLCFASEWLDQVVLLDGIPEGLSEDTRSDVVMVMQPPDGMGVEKEDNLKAKDDIRRCSRDDV